MSNEKSSVTGKISVVLKDQNGNVKQSFEKKNLITDNGHNAIADQLLASPSLGVPTHMGVGTGTGQTAASNALATALEARQAFDSKTRAAKVVTMVASWAAGESTGAITEAGIFDAISAGNMLAYNSFAAINKGVSDTLEITWTFTVA
jgi:hypothetical protein